MPDKEKVIKGLTAIEDEAYDRWVHRQYIKDPLITLIGNNVQDAITLLREQEPVKPNKPGTAYKTTWSCGVCAYPLSPNWVACPSCGKAVKWNADD